MSNLSLEEHVNLGKTAAREANRKYNSDEHEKEEIEKRKMQVNTAMKLGILPRGSAFHFKTVLTSKKSTDSTGNVATSQPKSYSGE